MRRSCRFALALVLVAMLFALWGRPAIAQLVTYGPGSVPSLPLTGGTVSGATLFQGGVTTFVRTRTATTDLVPGSVGSFINESMGASTGNTYGQIQVFTAGGGSPGTLLLQPTAGNVCVGNGATSCTYNLTSNGTMGSLDTFNVVLPSGSTHKAINTSQTGPSSNVTTYPGYIHSNQISGSFDAVVTGSGGGGTPTCSCWALFSINASVGPNYNAQESYGLTVGNVVTAAQSGTSDVVASAGGASTNFITGGRLYGGNFAASTGTGGGTPVLIGAEFDVAQGNSDATKVPNRFGINIINGGAFQASNVDTAIAIGHGPAGGEFQHVISLAIGNGSSAKVLNNTGDFLFSEVAQTVGDIINLPNLTVTGYVLNAQNSKISGGGTEFLQGYLMVGGLGTPLNTNPGDVNASRLALGGGALTPDIMLIGGTINGDATLSRGLHMTASVQAGVTGTGIGVDITPSYAGGTLTNFIHLRLGTTSLGATVTNSIAMQILANAVGATNNTGIQNNIPVGANNLGYDGGDSAARNIMSSLSLGSRTDPGGTSGSLLVAGSIVKLSGLPASAGGDVALCINTTSKAISTGPCVP